MYASCAMLWASSAVNPLMGITDRCAHAARGHAAAPAKAPRKCRRCMLRSLLPAHQGDKRRKVIGPRDLSGVADSLHAIAPAAPFDQDDEPHMLRFRKAGSPPVLPGGNVRVGSKPVGSD